ncbi:MAG TPA: hypothetical protein DHU56_04200 [Marinobacter sp.]|nr:hypothetical protein [Marinobacter sp.]
MKYIRPEWKHHRVIHSKHPPIDCFESPESLLLAELESETSDRVVNWPRFIAGEDYRAGPGWSPVMASFCYPREGRFNKAQRGAYYAGDSAETAIREWAWHTGQVWRGWGLTNEVSATVRCYTGQVTEPLLDIRGQNEYHHDTDYRASQILASGLLEQNEYGILYNSVRNPGSEAIALLRPTATTPVTQAGHYVLQWSGERFTGYAHIDEFKRL